MAVTEQRLREVLASRGGVLKAGGYFLDKSSCCAMECLSLALEQPINDHPHNDSPRDVWSKIINDADWSSDEARTEALLPTLVLPEPDEDWPGRLADATVKILIPALLREIAIFNGNPEYLVAANFCEQGTPLDAIAHAEYLLNRDDKLRILSAVRNARSAVIKSSSNSVVVAEYSAETFKSMAGIDLSDHDKYLRMGVKIAIDCWFPK